MLHIKALFDNEDDARQFMADYLVNYHPAGYGTSLTCGKTPTGQWYVKGTRGRSAD